LFNCRDRFLLWQAMVSGKLMSGEYLVKITRGLPAMDA
jgi:hypothetical protein